MKKLDGTKLDHKTREQIRIRAVKMVEAGESPERIVKTLGFHRSAIYQWIAKYREGGIDALKTRRITGRPPKLTGSQIKKIYDIITSKNPLQLKFEFALWTREMIKDLIYDRYKIKLSRNLKLFLVIKSLELGCSCSLHVLHYLPVNDIRQVSPH